MTERTYSMSELVQLTGFDARTIRYYISQGLLPKPLKRGRGADYSEIHLDRLKLISVLKGNLKLDEIQARLNVASPEEIRQLLETWVEPKGQVQRSELPRLCAGRFRAIFDEDGESEYPNFCT